MNPTAWTKSQDERLAELWASDMRLDDIGQRLRPVRSYESVRSRAKFLNLPARGRAPQRSRWAGADDRLKEMWVQGKSGSEIASRLGTTRSSVIGRIHRLGLQRTPEEIRTAQKAGASMTGKKNLIPGGKPKKNPSKKSMLHAPNHLEQNIAALQAVAKMQPLVIADPGLPRLFELRGCKWPVGDVARGSGDEQRFCGDVPSRGPYCAIHGRVAYGFVSERGRTKRENEVRRHG